MGTVKDDFLKHVKETKPKIKCAVVTITGSKIEQPLVFEEVSFLLLKKHTKKEYLRFIKSLDFYGDSFELSGTMWFKDGSWSSGEYFGNGNLWVNYKKPKTPKLLKR